MFTGRNELRRKDFVTEASQNVGAQDRQQSRPQHGRAQCVIHNQRAASEDIGGAFMSIESSSGSLQDWTAPGGGGLSPILSRSRPVTAVAAGPKHVCSLLAAIHSDHRSLPGGMMTACRPANLTLAYGSLSGTRTARTGLDRPPDPCCAVAKGFRIFAGTFTMPQGSQCTLQVCQYSPASQQPRWHTDATFRCRPPTGSLLYFGRNRLARKSYSLHCSAGGSWTHLAYHLRYSIEVPPSGGDTCFADAATAFERLPLEARSRR